MNETEVSMPEITELYRLLEAPIAAFDCGKKCGPLNERGAPFCCDTRHCVPAAYREEWDYLQQNTSLWHLWKGEDQDIRRELEEQVQDGQILIECQGHLHCQREYRTLDCRAFPFFPYLDSQGKFLGLSVLYDYRDRCWVISHLEVVTDRYRAQFEEVFKLLFQEVPSIRGHYSRYAALEREAARQAGRRLILLHRDGRAYRVDPDRETLLETRLEDFPVFQPYLTREKLRFPDEKT